VETECNAQRLLFQGHVQAQGTREVVAGLDGGAITSDAQCWSNQLELTPVGASEDSR
jgi:hypothetical protein